VVVVVEVGLLLLLDLEVPAWRLVGDKLKLGVSRSIALSLASMAEIALDLLTGFSIGFIPSAGILLRIFSSSSYANKK